VRLCQKYRGPQAAESVEDGVVVKGCFFRSVIISTEKRPVGKYGFHEFRKISVLRMSRKTGKVTRSIKFFS